MTGAADDFTGIVLAGGSATRLPGKLAAELGGRPLVAWPVAALASACERVAVVCKPQTELPELDAERWDEPADPAHPVAGLVHALERAGGPVLVCAADMPFVTRDALELLAAELRQGMKAAVAFADGRLQPLLGAYAPEALELLRSAPAGEPLTRTVETALPLPVDLPAVVAFNVNTPEDLERARAQLGEPGRGMSP